MNSRNNIRLRLVSYGVIAYMLMAFAWWSVLLFTKNRDAFYAKRDLMRIGMVAQGLITTDEEFFASERYQELEQQYRWQEWMIFGEALFFVLSLVGGIWLINRGYHKEVMAAKQRRNFLLSITHELKSPLASIRLVLETLQKRGQLKREQVEKLAGNGLFETDRLHMLVEDLLLSAKLETAYQPHTEPLNLSNMLQDLVDKLRNKYPRVDFHFEENVDDATLVGDKSGLTSVALNLLENAVKYSPDHPRIDVRLWQNNGSLHFEVADQGIGISDKEKALIFEKFYRVGSEDTRKTKGTGLGLYIVDQIVRAHDGNISVLDNEPQGTVFRIELPKGTENNDGIQVANVVDSKIKR
jgi:signal transduction histidine kinase